MSTSIEIQPVPVNLKLATPSRLDLRPASAPHCKFRYIGAEPMFDEQPKTSDQIRYIQILQQMIGRELEGLEVSGDILEPERIHFIESHIYSRDASNNEGTYYPASHSAVIRITSRGTMLSTLAEEMLHAAAVNTLLPHSRSRRSGYTFIINDVPFFHALNEGVTNLLKRDMLIKNLPMFRSALDLSRADENELIPQNNNDIDYPFYRHIVNVLMEGIAIETKTPYEEVHSEFKRGLFRSDVKTLCLIASVFGGKMVRDLAHLGLPDQDST